jgi:predicted NBD/HSP70 family sugar kinase/putative N-acetylmannosamine-6-phosphate epimerase
MMTRAVPDILMRLRGKLLVSCQAAEGDAFHNPDSMSRFARAVVGAGAAGIRANGPGDVAAIRTAVSVPIIGIVKQVQGDGQVLITPDYESARALVGAGADLVALDCTRRGQRFGALDRIRQIKEGLRVPVLADVATIDEGLEAVAAGADAVLTTMRGYTSETRDVREFEPKFVQQLAATVSVPVLAEGRIHSPEQAASAIAAGAFAVIVGTAITRPGAITRCFVSAVERHGPFIESYAIGIDLGGTNTKYAIVGRDGRLYCEASRPTPSTEGRVALLEHLKTVARDCRVSAEAASLPVSTIGVATAGWVDPHHGAVVYATENLPGWTGAKIRSELEHSTGLPVAVENDANALGIAEKHYGCARQVDDFVCITLGTGVGGACYFGGHLHRGAHFMGNGLGHINLEHDGLPCTCGQRGCLEVYSNAAALVRYAGGEFSTAEAVIQACNAGDPVARQAIRLYATYLARGCTTLIQLLDPELIVVSGGIAQNNPALLNDLDEFLNAQGRPWRPPPRVAVSPLGNHGGVLGAAALAFSEAERDGCVRTE